MDTAWIYNGYTRYKWMRFVVARLVAPVIPSLEAFAFALHLPSPTIRLQKSRTKTLRLIEWFEVRKQH